MEQNGIEPIGARIDFKINFLSDKIQLFVLRFTFVIILLFYKLLYSK